MAGLKELRVSLTKNGFFKIAEIIKSFPKDQILANLGGQHQGIALDRAQILKMLSGDETTEELPQVWDDVKALGPEAVEALTFISIIYSHIDLIEVFQKSITSEMRGTLKRKNLDGKVYTNIVDSMDKLKLGKKVYGADEFYFSLKPLFKEMAIGPLAKDILTRKLKKTGWKEPDATNYFQRDFYEQCFFFGFNNVLGISPQQFKDWLEGNTVEMEEPPACNADDDPVVVSGSLLAALATKPFVIMSGTSGTGKTQTVRALTRALRPKDVDVDFNHVFIPVEAGWTDGRNLLGYRNPFGKNGEYYASTPLIELLLRANYPDYSEAPFFIVLDEMNLSYVEQYFSRFLSLMETSYGANPEPVINLDELLLLQRAQSNPIIATLIESAIKAGGLFLSKNVFIVGTVNVDETTHMFSPKVLDRAFVLEFKPPKPSATESEFTIPVADALNGIKSAFWSFLIRTSPVDKAKADETLKLLDKLWDILGAFKFGPRITNESRAYVSECIHLQSVVAATSQGMPFFNDSDITDRLVNQKILPKLHGNKSVLSAILADIKKILEAEGLKGSEAKVAAMTDSLHKNHFANYFA